MGEGILAGLQILNMHSEEPICSRKLILLSNSWPSLQSNLRWDENTYDCKGLIQYLFRTPIQTFVISWRSGPEIAELFQGKPDSCKEIYGVRPATSIPDPESLLQLAYIVLPTTDFEIGRFKQFFSNSNTKTSAAPVEMINLTGTKAETEFVKMDVEPSHRLAHHTSPPVIMVEEVRQIISPSPEPHHVPQFMPNTRSQHSPLAVFQGMQPPMQQNSHHQTQGMPGIQGIPQVLQQAMPTQGLSQVIQQVQQQSMQQGLQQAIQQGLQQQGLQNLQQQGIQQTHQQQQQNWTQNNVNKMNAYQAQAAAQQQQNLQQQQMLKQQQFLQQQFQNVHSHPPQLMNSTLMQQFAVQQSQPMATVAMSNWAPQMAIMSQYQSK